MINLPFWKIYFHHILQFFSKLVPLWNRHLHNFQWSVFIASYPIFSYDAWTTRAAVVSIPPHLFLISFKRAISQETRNERKSEPFENIIFWWQSWKPRIYRKKYTSYGLRHQDNNSRMVWWWWNRATSAG